MSEKISYTKIPPKPEVVSSFHTFSPRPDFENGPGEDLDGEGFCFLKKMSGVRKLTTCYVAKIKCGR